MTENSLKTIFNKEVDKFHNKLISYIRGSIFELKRKHGLNNNEISDIFNIDKDMLSDFMHEDWNGFVDSRFLSILFLLSDSDFDFSKVIYDKPNNFIEMLNVYLDEYSTKRHEQNINELFKLLGIEDDTDLEATIIAIKEIIKNKKNGKKENY